MATCPKCSTAVPDNGRFCSTCGTSVAPTPDPLTETSTPSQLPTAAANVQHRRDTVTSHPSLDRSRFVPGELLDKRYRIVGPATLLSQGGRWNLNDEALGCGRRDVIDSIASSRDLLPHNRKMRVTLRISASAFASSPRRRWMRAFTFRCWRVRSRGRLNQAAMRQTIL